MFDIQQMPDKPNLLKLPEEKKSARFEALIPPLVGVFMLVGLITAFGNLIIPLAFGPNGSCTYSPDTDGDIEIHPPFLNTYESNCLVMGPPISRVAIKRMGEYGTQTIQYFEGALLMESALGEITVYPLGAEMRPSGAETDVAQNVDSERFNEFVENMQSDAFLGERVTDFMQLGERTVIYFENTSLRWHQNSQTASHQSLGRNHLLAHFPDLLIEDGTLVLIPLTPIRAMFDTDILATGAETQKTADDYTVNVAVKYPVLYADQQQVITVEVLDRMTGESAADLTIEAVARFAGSGQLDGVAVTLEPTAEQGIYMATLTLPQHPDGNAGREVVIDVAFDEADGENVLTVKKFQTWW